MFPIAGGSVTCGYGVIGPWAAGYHPGRDYRGHYVPIRATRDGVVQNAGWSWSYGPEYGLLLVIQSGTVRALYAHCSALKVRVGAHVKAGQLVAVSGNTGRTTGPHLHYEERVGHYTYWDHRRPQFDLTAAPLPVMDVSQLASASRRQGVYAQVSLFKAELVDVLRDHNRKVTDMGPGDVFGDPARENTLRLQRLWYPRGDWRAGVPGDRLTRRLGNRRDRWRTTS